MAELAAEAKFSLRFSNQRLAGYRSGVKSSQMDPRSNSRNQRRMLDPKIIKRTGKSRHQQLHLRNIPRYSQQNSPAWQGPRPELV